VILEEKETTNDDEEDYLGGGSYVHKTAGNDEWDDDECEREVEIEAVRSCYEATPTSKSIPCGPALI
jgi:hypothetical protein